MRVACVSGLMDVPFLPLMCHAVNAFATSTHVDAGQGA